IERQALLQNINMLNVKLRHSPRLASCSFAAEEEMDDFYTLSSSDHAPVLKS
ncbi:MAG: hypothetical protein K0R28_4411, partial [Paenibacillus sp.]|nr:hypothetical protein [Paenibacillus sp.]